MSKTPKERGFTPIALEFKTEVLERLRQDAKADQRSVGWLVRQIVDLHFAEIDAGRGDQWRQVKGQWVRYIPPSTPAEVQKVIRESEAGDIRLSDIGPQSIIDRRESGRINLAPPARPKAAKSLGDEPGESVTADPEGKK